MIGKGRVACPHDKDVRGQSVANPPFGAVENVFVAVPLGFCEHMQGTKDGLEKKQESACSQNPLSNVSKRYRYEWVFKKVNYTFESGGSYAIVGPNGSGKSTLMHVLSAYLSPTKGEVVHYLQQKKMLTNKTLLEQKIYTK